MRVQADDAQKVVRKLPGDENLLDRLIVRILGDAPTEGRRN